MLHPKFKVQLLLLLLIITKTSTFDVSRVNCTMYEDNRKCAISGLTVTSKNYTFVPIAPDANTVIKFEIFQSRITVLTSNICTTFTKIRYFHAIDQHIEIVEDYAFNNCTNVTDINLEKNNIHQIGVGSFSNTKQLTKLHILGGSMDHIDVDLFSNLGELKQLMFSANGLRELPVGAMKNLKNLELLYIYSNNLDDLDVTGLVNTLPNLKSIYLNDNNFHCDRLIDIVDTFKARGIITSDYVYINTMKRRDYIPRKVHNIICLTQAQLLTENLKRALTGSLEQLKGLPIGQAVIQLKEVVSTGFEDSDSAIVTLTTNLNETSDNLNEQIFNLNKTLQTNLHANINSANELQSSIKTVQKELNQNGKDYLAVQQQLGKQLNDSIVAQQKLEQKHKDNSVVQQKLDEKLKDMIESYRKHDELIASLMNKCKQLDTSLDEIKSGNSSQKYKSSANDVIIVWVCIVILILVDVAIVMTGMSFIRKFRRFSAIHHSSNQQLLQETFT